MLHKRFNLIRRSDLAMLLGLGLAVLLANVAAFGQDCEAIRSDVVRLHIMANSDSTSDQELKLAVRDRILSDVGAVFETPQSQTAAKILAERELPSIRRAAEAALRERGVETPVTAELCNMYFTTRQYGDISLPAGRYDAVRVTLGSGKGRNWWCVMYPPMCVPSAIPAQSPELSEIETLNSEPMFVPKLAVVEFFEGLHERASHPRSQSQSPPESPPESQPQSLPESQPQSPPETASSDTVSGAFYS